MSSSKKWTKMGSKSSSCFRRSITSQNAQCVTTLSADKTLLICLTVVMSAVLTVPKNNSVQSAIETSRLPPRITLFYLIISTLHTRQLKLRSLTTSTFGSSKLIDHSILSKLPQKQLFNNWWWNQSIFPNTFLSKKRIQVVLSAVKECFTKNIKWKQLPRLSRKIKSIFYPVQPKGPTKSFSTTTALVVSDLHWQHNTFHHLF